MIVTKGKISTEMNQREIERECVNVSVRCVKERDRSVN